MKLTGHHALVTGGAQGVGFALAHALVARGNRVTLLGRDPVKLARAASILGGAATLTCDLADAAQIESSTAALAHDPPTLLINNAAVQFTHDFTATDPTRGARDADLEIRANLTGLVQLTTHVLPLLRQAPSGAIVNVTSGLALAPRKTAAVYSATKAAVRTYTKALRYQVQDAGLPLLIVDAVLPMVDTPMTAGRGEGRKISPDLAARTILSGVEHDRTDIHVGPARPFVLLHRLAPRVAERLLRDG